jgi:hypothetical protein
MSEVPRLKRLRVETGFCGGRKSQWEKSVEMTADKQSLTKCHHSHIQKGSTNRLEVLTISLVMEQYSLLRLLHIAS